CDVPVVVCFAVRAAGALRFRVGIEEVIDPRDVAGPDRQAAITRRYMGAVERFIRRWPEQYFWARPWRRMGWSRRGRPSGGSGPLTTARLTGQETRPTAWG
ncbi:MAG: hypothetical protein ACE5K7_02160, partial [Phycisphaerae bacterium]